MEWSGRAPAPPAVEAGKGAKDKEHAISQTLKTAIAVVGIDIIRQSGRIHTPAGGRPWTLKGVAVGCDLTRRWVERSNDTETLPLRPFCRGCTIATRGYDFWKGQPLDEPFVGKSLHLDI